MVEFVRLQPSAWHYTDDDDDGMFKNLIVLFNRFIWEPEKITSRETIEKKLTGDFFVHIK